MQLERDSGVAPVRPVSSERSGGATGWDTCTGGESHSALGELIDQPSLRRAERLDAGRGAESLQSERPACAVANEPLETCSVLALDPDRCVDGESARPLPCAHVGHRGGVEEATPDGAPPDPRLHRVV